ncbi:putative pyridoxal reductase [Xylogone sp. PMI_703]|nr:putative pyridoxal reductase [Xylogone sp. PMI_703]
MKIVGKEVGPVGLGLLGFTWRPTPTPDAQAFATLRTALSQGANFWNGGDLYGTPTNNSLHLLNRYFTKYPEDASKVVLSIKVGASGSRQGIQSSLDRCLDTLNGVKSIDVFQLARITNGPALETTIQSLAKLVEDGKVGGIGLSEVDASTIRRAHKVHPIAAVEVELSLWSRDILTNGVFTTCKELGIPIVAYSPLGHGFLTGQIKKPSDIPAGDIRGHLARFQPGAFDQNMELVREVQKLASQKNCTAAQIAISWIKYFSEREGNPLVLPIPGATTSDRVIENSKHIELTLADLETLNSIFSQTKIVGGRYM